MPTSLIRTTQRNLLILWGSVFVANIGVIIYLYSIGWIEIDNLTGSIQKISTIYIPYLGMMGAFYWGGNRSPVADSDIHNHRTSGILALCFSAFYNGIITLFLVRLLFESGTIEDALVIIERLGATLGWLVAPVIGYYFVKSTGNNPK